MLCLFINTEPSAPHDTQCCSITFSLIFFKSLHVNSVNQMLSTTPERWKTLLQYWSSTKCLIWPASRKSRQLCNCPCVCPSVCEQNFSWNTGRILEKLQSNYGWMPTTDLKSARFKMASAANRSSYKHEYILVNFTDNELQLGVVVAETHSQNIFQALMDHTRALMQIKIMTNRSTGRFPSSEASFGRQSLALIPFKHWNKLLTWWFITMCKLNSNLPALPHNHCLSYFIDRYRHLSLSISTFCEYQKYVSVSWSYVHDVAAVQLSAHQSKCPLAETLRSTVPTCFG